MDEVGGDLEVATASGELRFGRVHGSAAAKNSNGATTLGHITGDVRVKSANGQISIERADANVVCKTAHGRTVIGELRQGEVTIAAAAGGIDIGIADGTAAWLDLNSQFGQVLNELEVSDGPGSSDRTVKVTAKTYSGDIVVRRSSPATADGPSAA